MLFILLFIYVVNSLNRLAIRIFYVLIQNKTTNQLLNILFLDKSKFSIIESN